MTNSTAKLGAKVRALRRREGLSQKLMAGRLGISPSYLNLIEHNRRPLTAPLLIKLVQQFQVDLQSFATDDGARLLADLREVLSDPLFEGHEVAINELKELAETNPNVSHAMLVLYRAYRATRERQTDLAESAADRGALRGLPTAQLPSEEIHELIQRNVNHFPELEAGAEALREKTHQGEGALDYGQLVRFVEREYGVHVQIVRRGAMGGAMRRYEPRTGRLTLSELLPPRSRHFQLAHQVGLLTQKEAIGRIVRDPLLTTDASRSLGRVAMANYFAGALLMPYAPFLESARSMRYDVELLGHRFRTSFEQVCHRLTTLRRPGAEGVHFHLIRVDMAGNISKRFSSSGIRFARFSGTCPRWNVFSAFQTPGRISVQLSRMPDDEVYFCIARTISRGRGGFLSSHALHAIGLGCRVEHGRELVYSDGVDLEHLGSAVPIGVTCRLCDRMDCTQRAVPPLSQPLKVDENVRGAAFYVPVED